MASLSRGVNAISLLSIPPQGAELPPVGTGDERMRGIAKHGVALYVIAREKGLGAVVLDARCCHNPEQTFSDDRVVGQAVSVPSPRVFRSRIQPGLNAPELNRYSCILDTPCVNRVLSVSFVSIVTWRL